MLLTAASLAQLPASYTAPLRGVVRNSVTHQPVLRAQVRIEGGMPFQALTDADGRFEIAEVPIGPQSLVVVKPGFRDSSRDVPGLLQPYADPLHTVIVEPGMADLELRLAPTNAIFGQVQLSTGEPTQGDSVQLLRRAVEQGRALWQLLATTKCDSHGNFRFPGLADGLYVVRTQTVLEKQAGAKPIKSSAAPLGFPAVFYPNARTLAEAAPFSLAHGEQKEANFLLAAEPFQRVTVQPVIPPDTEQDLANSPPTAMLLDADGNPLDLPVTFDAGPRTLQTLAPDGHYLLLVRLSQPHSEFDSPGMVSADTSDSTLAAELEFTIAGQPQTRLLAPLASPPALAVHIKLDPPPSDPDEENLIELTAIRTEGIQSDPASLAAAVELHPGDNTLSILPSANYWLHAAPGSGACERSFTAGAVNLGREPLRVGYAAAATSLQLEITRNCASLELSLPEVLTEARVGYEPVYTVYAVPDFATTADPQPVTLRPYTGAPFTLNDLPPGPYRLYFFRGEGDLEYRNPEALKQLARPGQPVTLPPGVTTAVRLEIAEK